MHAAACGPEPAARPSHACVRDTEPAALPSAALARRLVELCGDERKVQVDFLLHLSVFDARRDWAEAGYGSLWSYCLEVLHLREGSAWRRIEAMKLLRRFPALEGPLRSGALCLTTVSLLGPVLTEGNLDELVTRAAFLSKADTERLVVSLRPRVAPRDGIRRVGGGEGAEAGSLTSSTSSAVPVALLLPPSPPASAPAPTSPATSRPELRPVSEDTYSLRVTLDAACKAELDELAALISHRTGGDLAAVLREAIRCALAKHGKRRGAIPPERKRHRAAAPEAANAPGSSAAAPATGEAATDGPDPRAIPMEVRRAVWKRDGGRCAWVSPDGKRCESRWKLQLGHLTPVARGGQATVDALRLECGAHNLHEAVRVFGRAHMARFQPSLDFRWRKSP